MRNRHSTRQKMRVAIIGGTVLVVGFLCRQAYQLVDDAYHTSDLGVLLTAAAGQGDRSEVKELLRKGVNPNYNFRGNTPLKAAHEGKHPDIVKILEAAGAKE